MKLSIVASRWMTVSARSHSRRGNRRCLTSVSSPDLVRIEKATFYRHYPVDTDNSATNPALLTNVSFRLQNPRDASDVASSANSNWAIVSPSAVSRTTFLQILAGQHICIPPTGRSYPYLAQIKKSPLKAVQYVGFDAERGDSVGGSDVRGAYLSARYESRQEETDFTLLQYLKGETALNVEQLVESDEDRHRRESLISDFNLTRLLHMPVSSLSNGQTRRARIAKALMLRPQVLLLDGPFMGLDPRSQQVISKVLETLTQQRETTLVLSLKEGEPIPRWVTHTLCLDSKSNIVACGANSELQSPSTTHSGSSPGMVVSKDGYHLETTTASADSVGEILVEMSGVSVAYGDKAVLGNWTQDVAGEQQHGLWWKLSRGQRCAVFGPNGSGKTTLLSLVTSDHPQAYSLPIKLFGRSRLPQLGEPGISLFDIQKRIGHASPEVHAFFPKSLCIRRVLESAWADAPLARPVLTDQAHRRVDAYLRWWKKELCPNSMYESSSIAKVTSAQQFDKLTPDRSDLAWAAANKFGELSFSSQRLLLFLRAMVAEPDLVILDEALSGVDEGTRNKALQFLSWGETRAVDGDCVGETQESDLAKMERVVERGLSPRQALLVISHSRDDVPGCIREWICLPDPGDGRPPRSGRFPGPLDLLPPEHWDEVWK